MKKLFGEFLIEKNKITKAQLLEALMKQINDLPPVAKVIQDSNLLDPEEILSVMREQVLTGSEFLRACIDTGVWKSEFKEKIDEELKKYRVPIGTLLVQTGALSADDLREALEEYFENFEQETVKFNPDEARTDKNGLKIYLWLFNEDKYKEIKNLIDIDDIGLVQTSDILLRLHDHLLSLEGGARLAGARLSEALYENAERWVQFKIRNKEDFSPEDGKQMSGVMEQAWGLRKCLHENGNEAAYYKAHQKDYLSLFKGIK